MIPFVYIVDDDMVLQIIIKTKLSKLNVVERLEIFSDAKEALDNLSALKSNMEALPNVILLDLNMPGFDGYDFLKVFETLTSDWLEKPLIYILTSSVSERYMDQTKSFSIVKGFFIKPLSDKDIATMIKDQNL